MIITWSSGSVFNEKYSFMTFITLVFVLNQITFPNPVQCVQKLYTLNIDWVENLINRGHVPVHTCHEAIP